MRPDQAAELVALTRALLYAVGALTVGTILLLALLAVRSFLEV